MAIELTNEGGHPIPYKEWVPYCLICSTLMRMEKKNFGYKCMVCGNEINHDLTHHEKESS